MSASDDDELARQIERWLKEAESDPEPHGHRDLANYLAAGIRAWLKAQAEEVKAAS